MLTNIKYYFRYLKIILKRRRKTVLAFLALIVFLAYFWNRFLRTRISKDLPLNLSLYGFFILLCIIIIFTYIVYSLMFARKANPIIEKIIEYIYIPFKELDKGIKNISFVKENYSKFLTFIFPLLELLIIKTPLFFIIFWIIPRIILLYVLFRDIFIFYKFELRYDYIYIGLFLLFNRCFKYSLKNTKGDMVNMLRIWVSDISTKYYPMVHPAEINPENYDIDEQDLDDWGPEMCLPFNIYIEHYTEYLVYNNITNRRNLTYTKHTFEYFYKKYLGERMPDYRKMSREELKFYKTQFGDYSETSKFVYKKMDSTLEPQLDLLLRISVLLEYYDITTNQNKYYKYLKIIIFSSYLICWLYVLVISIPHMPLEEWNKLIMYLNKYETALDMVEILDTLNLISMSEISDQK